MLKKLSKQFKKLDLLGTPFALNYDKSPSFTTQMGAIFTILCGVISLFIFIFLFYQLLDSSNVELTITEISLEQSPRLNLFEANYFTFINIGSVKRTPNYNNGEDLTKFFTIVAYSSIQTIDYTLSPPKLVIQRSKINYIRCSKAKKNIQDKYRSNEIVKYWLDSFSYCPDIEDPTKYKVGGSSLDQPYENVEIRIYPCSLSDKSKCLDITTFDPIQIYMFDSLTVFDHENYSDPIKLFFDTRDPIDIDPFQTQFYRSKVRKVEILDDVYDFLPIKERGYFIEFEKTTFSTTIRETKIPNYCDKSDLDQLFPTCQPYLKIDIVPGSKLKTVDRKYTTLLEILSEVGGAYQFLILVASLIYSSYNERQLNKYLRSTILKNSKKEFVPFFKGKKIKDVNKLMNEVLESRQSATKLFEMIGVFEILEEIIFQEYHIALMPLVQLKRASLHANLSKENKNSFSNKKIEDQVSIKEDQDGQTILNSLKRLKKSRSEDPLTAKIDKLFLNYIEKYDSRVKSKQLAKGIEDKFNEQGIETNKNQEGFFGDNSESNLFNHRIDEDGKL